jgi:hypothetical protein
MGPIQHRAERRQSSLFDKIERFVIVGERPRKKN